MKFCLFGAGAANTTIARLIILAGADPKNAVYYQIVVMFMLAAATAIGSVLATLFARKQAFTKHFSLRDLPMGKRR